MLVYAYNKVMQDSSRYAVGIDVGTTTVRCVVGHIDATTGTPTIVGVGEVKNNGMRKGTVVNLNGVAPIIDQALNEAERMSGHEVHAASVSINGSHILSTSTDGMVAVGAAGHEVTDEDTARLEDVATTGKVPPNREVLEVVSHSYSLDGQDNIKNPIGMIGTRLEVNANVVSAMAPQYNSLTNVFENLNIATNNIVPSVVASSRAVLTEQQIENGVVVIDFGGATTGVAVYEEGDLQYISVIPVGGNNITNDLAIGLKTDPEIAEQVKLTHGSATPLEGSEKVTVKHDKETFEFARDDVNDIIDARLEELFETIVKELKKFKKDIKFPGGVVLVGGGSKLKNIADYAKDSLGMAVRVGSTKGYSGVAEHINEPQYAAVVGLMLTDVAGPSLAVKDTDSRPPKQGAPTKKVGGLLKNLISKLRV